MQTYTPAERAKPKLMTKHFSAWGDIPTILKDIIRRFNINTRKCIEFGVEFGYSTSAFANYFDSVVGVDTFTGDVHAGFRDDHYAYTSKNLRKYKNIKLIQSTYQDYILKPENDEIFDCAHIDIIHTYEDTFACGEWTVQRSKVTLFHDTISFPDVKKACVHLAEKYNLRSFNYLDSHGLGILYNPNL
jgi:predicted O-methyltransferase YrrM